MLITSVYNKDTLTEKAWYQSSNIFYSEFIENPVKNEGDLYVTFNNGATYKYKNVQITPDYVMFKHGGLEGSHGKALNSHIKPKYEFEKVDNRDINQLISEKELCLFGKEQEKYNKTYFISGHRDISHSDFIKYRTTLAELIEEKPDALFVLGDYHGVDIFAQNYLIDELNIDPSQITVYHMGETPQNINPKITNTVGGFATDEERDSAMTSVSFKDIAFIKDNTQMSGTAQNILRRFLMD